MPEQPARPQFVDPRKRKFAKPKSRRTLAHLYKPGGTYFITFRLFDAVELRMAGLEQGEESLEPAEIAQRSEPNLTLGACCLAKPENAKCVQDSLLHFHGERYFLHAWCVMPNHVHLVVTPMSAYELSDILKSWKGYTARQINAFSNATGALWQQESFDHLCRQPIHVEWFIRYTLENPVAAGLCKTPEDWPFGGRNG